VRGGVQQLLDHIESMEAHASSIEDALAGSLIAATHLAQCEAAVSGLGIVMLPTFVAAGVPELIRIVPDGTDVRRDIWVSVRKEQGALTRIRSVMKFLTHIFETDRVFLLGSRSGGDHGRA
jgi:DNA-binding transcriptional LysR family regulator